MRKALLTVVALAFSATVLGQAGAPLAPAEQAMFDALKGDNSSALMTQFLRGANPNAVNAQGQTALVLALRDGQLKVAEQLFGHPDIQLDRANAQGETPLMMAALHGRLGWMSRLMDRGAAVTREGWTPLHYAAASPEPEAAKLLVARGAALDARSPNGTTPLMMAARYGDERTALWLLEQGADARLRNEQGLDAGDFARHVNRLSLAERIARGR